MNEPPRPARPAAIVFDFDGTAVTLDIGDEICRRFADPSWVDWDRAWERGELPLVEVQRRVWPLVRCGADALAAWLAETVRFRAGFRELVEEARARAVPVVIASQGFDLYIRPALATLGPAAAGIRLYANHADLVDGAVAVDFPHHERFGCERCALCKARVVEALRAGGRRVAFFGDGTSDRCVAGRADRLYAVEGEPLARLCRERGVPVRPFRTFAEVRDDVLSWMDGAG